MASCKVYMEPGGDEQVVANGGQVTVKSGGEIEIESGGAIEVESGGALNAAAASGLTVNSVAFSGCVRGGTYTADADDATADTLDIATGLATVGLFVVRILRAGVDVTADAAQSESSGTLTVADGAATYVITADDVIYWLAIGT